MYFVGIGISKYKHDCFNATESGDVVCNSFTVKNNQDDFNEPLIILDSLYHAEQIKIGLESTGHYAVNLKLFI